MLYGLIVKDARARAWLWAEPLIEALSAGRPCVLISSCAPDTREFALVLRDMPVAQQLRDAIDDGRLKVLQRIGDYSIHLFRQGAHGFVDELQALHPQSGTLFVVDQADDLFTCHDHRATEEQASCYRRWCDENGHTLMLVFLRTSLMQPLLGGNQAALTFFDGLAEARLDPQGLRLRAEFWEGAICPETVSVKALGAWPASPVSPEPQTTQLLPRTQAWYVGVKDLDRTGQVEDVDWQVVDSIDDLLDLEAPTRHAVLELDKTTDLEQLMSQLQSLRVRLGKDARVILRERGFRLREFPQRLMLRAAGADDIVAEDQPLNVIASSFTRVAGTFESNIFGRPDASGNTAMPDLQSLVGLQQARRGRLSMPRFCDEVDKLLQLNEPWGIPCTLVELPLNASGAALADLFASHLCRPGDVSAQTREWALYFFQGCRPRDAVNVIERSLATVGMSALVEQVRLCGGASIPSRLESLQRDDGAPLMAVSPSTPKTAALPHAAIWAIVVPSLLLALTVTASAFTSQPVQAGTTLSATVPTHGAETTAAADAR